MVSPLAAFFGGIVAQEIVKFTGKYSPMKQWLHYDLFLCLPEGTVDRTPKNCRYDDQIRVFGNEIQDKLAKVQTFLVGAGALGCEFIKAFALMGIGCSTEGQVTCTDNDTIEVSNLNRQFLFRKNNVGHPKSEVACASGKEMNPEFNVKHLQTFVSPETEDVFNDEFWEKLNFIVNAVDNIKARLYVDARCVWYGKPLLESGTLGTKANSQMVVPHQTQCYGDSQDPPEESIPMCTLRNFPNIIEHCIEWGRDLFNKFYSDTPNDAISYLDSPKGFEFQLRQNTTITGVKQTFEGVEKILDMKKSADFAKCIEMARLHFEANFNHQIQNLLNFLPEDHLDRQGRPFWSGPKRAPSPISYDPNDDLHAHFIVSCANLIAFTLGIKQNRDKAAVAKAAVDVVVPGFKLTKIKIELPPGEENKEEEKKEEAAEPSLEDEDVLKSILGRLGTGDHGCTSKDIVPVDFEKDDDENYHIDFIHAASNLRARNYKINECPQQKTKMIAGKIIPAIATTTAMITGAVTAEIYKYVAGKTNIEVFSNGFINLAIPLFVFSEPTPTNLIKTKDFDPIMCGPVVAIPENYTIWDKIDVKGPMTF